ncbi:MAG: 4-hydroxythreonine-4-phosphate dehydrogenase PdxA [Alphaproteobacteria bacterium]|nr:MAG: 4-hydroxythreonine-4-phosphate dehydrogenase PdxA [Alphaproteobacteria bacterium]
MDAPKPIFVTMGEPGGVGAEITLRAWMELRHTQNCCFILHHDPDYLRLTAQTANLDIPLQIVQGIGEAPAVFKGALPVLPIQLNQKPIIGQTDTANVPAISSSIKMGVELCRAGKAAAMVTNPINKAVMIKGGFQFPGHTEYLSHLCGGVKPVMMLANDQLRVVPLTVHTPIRDVAMKINRDLILQIAKIVRDGLQGKFGIKNPILAFAGLNPHAGEDGEIGREEIDIFAPALAELRNMGMQVMGPLSADTMFFAEARREYDVAICAYHDQALIPVKTVDFWRSVNVTLGLDIIRTSPDHGTALDIAGRGIARGDSMIAAIQMAAKMAGSHG